MPGTPPFHDVVTDVSQLEALCSSPSRTVATKKIDHVDDGAAALVAASSLVLVGTADAQGRCTVSPRGGSPGFVRVLDPHRLLLPHEPGNRLLDSARNLLVNPQVGLLFVLPGLSWTLRVSGRAWLTCDPELLEGRAVVAVGVQVESVFVHCGQAFEQGGVWDPASWGAVPAPDAVDVFRGHVALRAGA